MAQAADTGGSGLPFVKFNEIGDTLVGAFGSSPRECKRQQTDYDSKKPKVKADGKPAFEEVMWFVAMPGTTATTGNAESGFTPIQPGDEVRYSVSGWKWGQVIDARKNLPAANGFAAGQPCSGDVYTITLVGFSAETRNPAGAEKAGFTVVDGRIILRTTAEREQYILHQARTNGGNTNPAKDFEVTIRRPEAADKRWEQQADAMFSAKPWLKVPATVGADDNGADDEPFVNLFAGYRSFRNMAASEPWL